MRQLYVWMLVLCCGWSSSGRLFAQQQYETLWKEVEVLQKKDLPKSQLDVLDKIYRKGIQEKNLPQAMKAFLMKGRVQCGLTPDSTSQVRRKLEEWAAVEKDAVGRAVLNSLLAASYINEPEADTNQINRFIAASLKDKALLGKVSAKDFAPMTESGSLSETFFEDNMYDLLVRQSVRTLSGSREMYRTSRPAERCDSLYAELTAFYEDRDDRRAALLVKLARVQHQYTYLTRWRSHTSRLPEQDEALRRLITEYRDLPVCADVYLKLADYYNKENEKVEAMKVVEEGLRNYPDGEWAPRLAKMKKRIQAPSLRMELPFVYPSQQVEVHLEYANLKEVCLEWYRLDISPRTLWELENDYRKSEEVKPEYLLEKYGKKVDAMHYAMPPTPDYQHRDTILYCTLPKAGIYVLKQQATGSGEGEETSTEYVRMHLSPYQCMAVPVAEEQNELRVVDAQSGQPVSGAEIVMYMWKDGKSQLYETVRTDEQGSAILPHSLESLHLNVRTRGNDFMQILPLRGYAGWVKEEAYTLRPFTSLFTDRSLYRPGQTVYVSGIVYERRGDEMRALKGEKRTLKLFSEGRPMQELTLSSDEYGVLSGEFVLPQTLLAGYYRISCEGGSVGFRVEEYKRPTFDVVFTPYTAAYDWGDSLTVKAVARSFSGAPVRDGIVSYRVLCSEMYGFRGFGGETEVASGKLATDEEGSFRIPLHLVLPEEVDRDREVYGRIGMERFYHYKVVAEVRSRHGETQQGSLNIPMGGQSVVLNIRGLEQEVILREKADSIQVQAFNLSRQPVSVDVIYKLYRLDIQQGKERLQAEGKIQSAVSFLPEWLKNGTPGKYRIEVSATDSLGRTCKAAQSFVLFSGRDSRLPVDTVAWFWQDGSRFEEGNSPVIYVGSSEKDVCLFVDVYQGDRRIESQRWVLNGEIKSFSYPYRPMYKEGIQVYYTFVRKGSLYCYQAVMTRPEPDKQLNLSWKVFRDHLLPGGREEWEISVTDLRGKPAQANLMATLYDASLDKLFTHNWYFGLSFPRQTPYVGWGWNWGRNRMRLYAAFPAIRMDNGLEVLNGEYSRLWNAGWSFYEVPSVYVCGVGGSRLQKSVRNKMSGLSPDIAAVEEFVVADAQMTWSEEAVVPAEENPGRDVAVFPVRENFAETAFFYPNLRTDSTGRVSVKFTVPDALTEWRFMGLAHTQSMDYGILKETSVASKPFMIQPNLPRFVRWGDKLSLAASLMNLSTEQVAGNAGIHLYDPISGEVVCEYKQAFSVDKGKTETVRFDCRIPDQYEILVCKVVAEAGAFTDGEQHYLPVLSDKQWVTEALPVQLEGAQDTVIQLAPLWKKGSKTAQGHRLTVELTAHPEWYVVQALPVLANPQEEDALAWASAYYAQQVARGILAAHPRIREVLEAWSRQGEKPEQGWSKLAQNQELKNMLLTETPWLAEAATEAEQKRRLAGLFDLNQMEQRTQTMLRKLQELQLADGSWSWYQGMSGNRFITTQIVEMLARTRAMQLPMDETVKQMYRKAFRYLKTEVEKEYLESLRKEKGSHKPLSPSEQVVRYLSICASDTEANTWADATVNTYFIRRLEDRSADYSIYEKSLIASIMHAAGRDEEAKLLVASVKEYLVNSPEMGSYFDTSKAAYSWSSYRIPTHVAAMEAIARIAPDEGLLAAMKQWLLTQKRVQTWGTSVATVDAVYAFLSFGNHLVSQSATMQARVGKEKVCTVADVSGTARKSWTDKDVWPETVEISRSGPGTGWASIYVQYQEDRDKIQASGGEGLQIRRTYLKEGKVMTKREEWHVGDKVTVRLTVTADRDMDFVQIKDERASCMEPSGGLSGYRWGKEIAYYGTHRDAASCFFIDRLRKGTYVIEYEVYVDRAGTYRAGAASVQSVYAPEFAAHTSGVSLKVR